MIKGTSIQNYYEGIDSDTDNEDNENFNNEDGRKSDEQFLQNETIINDPDNIGEGELYHDKKEKKIKIIANYMNYLHRGSELEHCNYLEYSIVIEKEKMKKEKIKKLRSEINYKYNIHIINLLTYIIYTIYYISYYYYDIIYLHSTY